MPLGPNYVNIHPHEVDAMIERRREDNAAAVILFASGVEIDIRDHRRPSEILSGLVELGVIPVIQHSDDLV